MDVNGTRFHLIKGKADWLRCREEKGGGEPAAPGEFKHLHLDEDSSVMTLNPLLRLFLSAKGESSLAQEERRGAASDMFGNWYWISNDRRKIFWRPEGSKKTTLFWSQEDEAACPSTTSDFKPRDEREPTAAELSGLTITSHHYLVVGNRTESGIFIFDLHAGGAPTLLLFPATVAFEPFDMASAPGGGVWILDRKNRAYWGLNRQFCVVSEKASMSNVAPGDEGIFHTLGSTATVKPERQFPNGFSLEQTQDPVAIESLPDGSVLILDSPAFSAPAQEDPPAVSRLHHYRMSESVGAPIDLSGNIEAVDEVTRAVRSSVSFVGYDFAFLPDERGATRGLLYVVERAGNQSILLRLDLRASPRRVEFEYDFLPMHYFGGRSLLAFNNGIYYDVAGGDAANDHVVQWLQLQTIEQPFYQRTATLMTYVLDGRARDCVWHRLFLDACIPPEADVEAWTRAHNDSELLQTVVYRREPDFYLRAAGPEVPFYNPFSDVGVEEGTGTWELLFQEACGRYLEIKLVLNGNGRNAPRLHALRAYYPRFSYPKNYLPAVYLEEPESASFLERFLANEEGFYSEIEGKIGNVSMLFDARGAPREALDWLAGWMGLVLDPLWAKIQQRGGDVQAGGGSNSTAKFDRRRLFIRFARKFYESRGTAYSIQFALHLLLDPCLEVTLKRLKSAALRPQEFAGFIAELEQLGLSRPTASMKEEEFEELLYEYLLTPRRPSKVRIVERYRTRGGRRLQEGDPSRQSAAEDESSSAFAHQFSVLVPETMTEEEEAMVKRIAELEKPAHTRFDIRRYWDFFRVGEVRLGIDTVLGQESRFLETILNRSYLAEGYLTPAHPMDVGDRLILDRDGVGDNRSL